MSRLVAVIDIGKTNKKVALYDEGLRQVAFREAEFAAAPGGDGVLHEPVDAMWDWLKRQLRELFRERAFDAIAVSTHGATFACLDVDGELAVPVVAYDQPLSDEEQRALDERFYDLCGPPERLQDETGTCDLPLLINPAKALLWLKGRYRDGFAKTTHILYYPQFWGHRLTRVLGAEPTYAFNHAYLHDIRTREPSSAARALGVEDLVPRRFQRPWDRLGTLHPTLQVELELPPLPVAVGIHDSNAALLPYLLAHRGDDFVLNSTGTWCVAMHGVEAPRYRPDELGSKVLINVDALGGFQKTSFLMGGQEYACYHELIGGDHVGFDAARVDAALAEPEDRILPGAFPSQFPHVRGGATEKGATYDLDRLRAGERPAWFGDRERAHDLLNVSIALQTRVALERTGVGPRTRIFVEGGFRNNPTYLATLAALFPDQTVACTSLEQATGVGTAICGHALAGGVDPQALAQGVAIDEDPVRAPELPHLAAYAASFFERVSS